MMEREIFEEVEGLSIVSISDINFAYNTNVEGYTMLSSDIPKLYAIVSKKAKYYRFISYNGGT